MAKKEISQRFQLNFSFSQKVWLYALSVSFFSLLLAALSFISYDIKETRQGLIATSELQADIIATQSMEALMSGRSELAQEIVDAIGSNKYVRGAWIYDKDFNLFLSYDPNRIGWHTLPKIYHHPDHYFQENELTVVRAINVGPQVLGTIVIKSALDGIYTRAIYQITTVLVVMLISLGCAMLLSIRFQKSLTRPLEVLLKALEKITKSNDYSVRVEKLSNDDLGVLTDAFNNMLHEVESKNMALKTSEERLHLALWGSNEVLFDWNLESDWLYFDSAIEKILGFPSEKVPKSLNEYMALIHPVDRENFKVALDLHVEDHVSHFESECRIKNHNHAYQWILIRGKVVDRDKKGAARRLIGTFSDIHTRKESEEELKLFHKVFASTTEGVVIMDTHLRIVQCNKAFTVITGYQLSDVKGELINLLYSDKQSQRGYRDIQKLVLRGQTWVGELMQVRKSGEHYPSHLSFNAMKDDDGQILHFVGVFSDLTNIKKNEDKLDYLTYYDPLTNLANRELLKKTLDQSIKAADEMKDSIGLMIIGIDNFKILNDTFGHLVGDQLLKRFADRLKLLVHDEHHLARLGGDEFAYILKSMTDKNQLKELAQTILETMSESFKIDNDEIVIGCCLGISVYPHDGHDTNMMITNADTAMVHAKKERKNSYQFFTKSMNDQVSARQKLESMLRKAIEHQEFELYYQPKIDAKTEQVMGAEALIRWHSSETGAMIGPDKFIPIAEDSGLILPLSDWIVRQACMQGQLWHHQGWQDFSMAVNISAIQFNEDDFFETITKYLHETGFKPECLDLEITEGAIMSNMDRCIDLLSRLKAVGMKVSIDDFGTGYSSLSYIKQFPVDTIKIDQSFVKKIITSPEDAHIVAAVLSMAKGLKLKTVAEGVETQAQLIELQKLGCDIIQGYYYSKPLSAREFEAFYMEQNRKKRQDAS